MKSILQGIQADLRDFIGRPSLSLLIVSCEIEHSALLLKSLDALEQDPAVPDIFLTFGHEFDTQSSYVEEILATLRQQITQINEEIAEGGDPLIADLPAELEDQSDPPPARLAKLLRHVRSVAPDDCQVIWVFYPTEVIDQPQYLRLIGHLLGEMEKSSLNRVKIIVRDVDSSPSLASQLEGHPRTKVYRPKLDPDSFEKLLTAKASDPAIPAEERAQMHMMLAGYDLAHQRFDTALARNKELLAYFTHTNQPYNRSILLNNIGDLYYIQKKWPEARIWYERAVGLSAELKSQPLVFSQSVNLGNALYMQNDFAQSLVYYRASEKYAESSGLLLQRIQILERIGSACHRKGELEEAAEALEKAAGLNEKIENIEGRQANLEQLSQIYSEMGDEVRYRKTKLALSALSANERARQRAEESAEGAQV
jgi:tetratricopeptide (TPR) repeat protein